MEEIDRHFHCCILHLEVTNTSKKLYCFEANYILYPVWIWLSTMSFLVAIIHILMWAVYINISFLVLHNLKKVNLLFWNWKLPFLIIYFIVHLFLPEFSDWHQRTCNGFFACACLWGGDQEEYTKVWGMDTFSLCFDLPAIAFHLDVLIQW